MTTNKHKALEILRQNLDLVGIQIGTYKAAVGFLGEKNVSPERAKGITEFFRRWIND